MRHGMSIANNKNFLLHYLIECAIVGFMNDKQTDRERQSRVQAMVPYTMQRRIKAAAALSGVTLEEWLAAAAGEKLERDGVPQVVA